jgi:hypothetical protein
MFTQRGSRMVVTRESNSERLIRLLGKTHQLGIMSRSKGYSFCTCRVCVGYAKLLPLRWMIAMTSSSRSCLIFVNSA